MDRRVFEMLEMYNRANNHTNNNHVNNDYCIKTDYNANADGILTMAFVNMQPIDSVYEIDEGFHKGTIFPNIDKPFYGGKK